MKCWTKGTFWKLLINLYFKLKSWMKSLYTNWECDLEISWSNFKTIYWSFLCSIIVPTYLLKHPIKAWTILELSNITESQLLLCHWWILLRLWIKIGGHLFLPPDDHRIYKNVTLNISRILLKYKSQSSWLWPKCIICQWNLNFAKLNIVLLPCMIYCK